MNNVEEEGPIELAYLAAMNRLAQGLDEFFNPGHGGKREKKQTGFALLVFPFDDDDPKGRMNYISNANRETMLAGIKELLASLEGRKVKAPEATQ